MTPPHKNPALMPLRISAAFLISIALLATIRYNYSAAKIAASIAPHGLKFCDPRPGTAHHTCIFDIGLNTGQDTQLYLQSPNVRVVAVEANPQLVSAATAKFSAYIAQGRLEILGVGLVGNASVQPAKLSFYVSKLTNRFSSFNQQIGCRGPQGILEAGNMTYCTKMDINTRSCEEILDEFGTPTYMKIDIEGMDKACLISLGNVAVERRPKYVSKENVHKNDLLLLTALGYKKFKVVNQAVLQDGLVGDDEGHSGPWGEDARDVWTGIRWQTKEDILKRLPLPEKIMLDGKERSGWYDIHASQ